METKVCAKCKIEKPFSAFSNSKNASSGKKSRCKECLKVEEKHRAERNAELRALGRVVPTDKTCSSCNTTKPPSEFHKAAKSKDGLATACRDCKAALDTEYAKNNVESCNARKYKHREKYPERISAANKKWSAANPHKRQMMKVRRRILEKNAFVAWANLTAIEDIYLEARRLSEETGISYHVDHIIPLTHDLVCGLHVENNLQIIPAVENLRKRNKFTPGSHM